MLLRRASFVEGSGNQGWRQALEAGTLAANSTVYEALLRQCMVSKDLPLGRLLHGHLVKTGQLDSTLGNLVVQVYAKCGCVQDAIGTIDCSVWNVYSWTMIVAAYAHSGHPLEALKSFHCMDLHGVKPNQFCFLTALGLVAGLGPAAVNEGAQLHARVAASSMAGEVPLDNAIVSMYGKCGELHLARQAFDNMSRKDVVSWNSMIAAYAQNGYCEEALEVLAALEESSHLVQPDSITYVCALGACSNAGALEEGRQIHRRLLDRGMPPSDDRDLLANTLVHMYARCGSLQEARTLFDRLECKQPVTWSFLLGQYSLQGQPDETWRLFRWMELEGVKANKHAFVGLLEACCSWQDIEQGREVHDRMLATGFDTDLAVLSMYARCGDLRTAKEAFDGMADRNVACWNAMITAYAQLGRNSEALQLYRQMDPEGVKANDATYVAALGVCSNSADLKSGRQVHARIVASGYDNRVYICNSVLNMYTKCRSLDEARLAFQKMVNRDVVTWNCMVAAYAQLGQSRQALDLYREMETVGVKPNRVTLVNVLAACMDSLEDARAVHTRATADGFDSDIVLGTALVNVYGKCGCLEEAKAVFQKLADKNVVSWSAMIAAYSDYGFGREAHRLLRLMELDGVHPNDVTLVSVVDACSSMGTITLGRKTHERIVNCGFESDVIVGNALVNMYAKCGELANAKSFFDAMQHKDVITWTAMIASYAQHGHTAEAMLTFRDMGLNGVNANEVTFVSVLFSCSHASVVEDGWEQFVSMVGDYGLFPVAEHYSCMVDLLSRAGWLEQAEELMISMPFEPDRAAWMSLLAACKVHSRADKARKLADLMRGVHQSTGSVYVVMSNILATNENRSNLDAGEHLIKQELLMEEAGACSWIEVKDKVHEFISGDRNHPRIPDILEELNRLKVLAGFSEGLQEQDQEANVHSEILAVVFGFLSTPASVQVRVVKNQVEVCRECHRTVKLISKVVGRRIMVRDSKRFHNFEGGMCSCGD